LIEFASRSLPEAARLSLLLLLTSSTVVVEDDLLVEVGELV
jgi:hypothetical protein